MRLSGLLEKEPSIRYQQVERFLNTKLKSGTQRKLDIGNIGLNFHCIKCENVRTFWSDEKIYSLGVDDKTISIDVNLTCRCGNHIQAWFLVESEELIYDFAPSVRIVKKGIRLGDSARIDITRYGDESLLIEKADIAYGENLGAGAMVYLRMIFEKVTKKVADEIGIPTTVNQRKKSFRDLLLQVDERHSIIPQEFKNDRYKLFKELSKIVHGESTENDALLKYIPSRRLIIGILDNIKNNAEISDALSYFDWEVIESEVTR